MAKIEDCPGFETFGADVKAARKAKQSDAQGAGRNRWDIEWRYLANIENKGTIPSLPVVIQLIKICGLPVEQYFNPEIMRGGKRTAAAGQPQAETLPGTLFCQSLRAQSTGRMKIEQSDERNGGCVKTSSVFRFCQRTASALSIFLPFFQRNPVFCG